MTCITPRGTTPSPPNISTCENIASHRKAAASDILCLLAWLWKSCGEHTAGLSTPSIAVGSLQQRAPGQALVST